ncbi:PAS domain S-box protein [Acetobacterium paludosum]|uniref:histidine kinase n=1 Tax=Acetobacterium paludosum TaxID=52693 RepID=A0A923I4E4_9FIRM|nr:ATP-binding protein [Acetobacterium paludosum]MBC3888840.1 PAS domain S-box protein [Acetobacterium paludosum]
MTNKICNPTNDEITKMPLGTKINEFEEKETSITALIIAKEQAEAKNVVMIKELEHYRNFFKISLDIFLTVGPDGMITDVNMAAENAVGIPREKLIGKEISTYVTDSHKVQAGHQQIIREGVIVDHELNLKHVNGATTPFLFNASSYKDSDGKIVGVFAAGRNITATRKAEDDLTHLKNNLTQLVKQRAEELILVNKELAFQNEEKKKRAAELIIANKELTFQNEEKADRAAELIIADKELAFQSEEKADRAAELVIADKELAFQSEEKADRAAELIIANKELAFQTEEKADRAAELIIADKELAFQSEEKADRAAELIIANKELAFQNEEKDKRASELIIANKELAFQSEEKADRAAELIIANKELAFQNEEKDKRAAELVHANEKLACQKEKIEKFNNQLECRVIERTAELESLNKELEAFSYSMSHDLKAPLRHIAGYISLLIKKYGSLFPKEGEHYLDMISFSVENMNELIEGLLHFSRSGRIDMNKKILNMNEIVNTLIQPIKEQEIERKIEFNIEPMPLAFGDLEMMKSVWANLIENAVKFTRKEDFTKIVIGANEEKDENIYYIKDNGVGFDMNYSSKLFTVFQRLHLRKDYEGTGIGLATVKRVITRHGGKIWAESKVGEGASFYFSLINRKGNEKTWK